MFQQHHCEDSKEEFVAIGLSACSGQRTDNVAATRAVLDHDLLPDTA